MSLTGLNISKLDKSKTKFKSIEINKVYKGNTVETQKTSGSARQHGGLQVLGKVGPARRMPPPVHLPSLKSEHGFSDPVSLVPTGGSGWGGNSKDEEKNGGSTSTISVPVSSTQPTFSKSGMKEINLNGASISSGQLWSNVTSGKQVSKKKFQEDFPELAANPEDKVQSPSPKKDDVKQESRISLGPSLKPQNMLSWREGGGRRQVEEEEEEDDEEKRDTSDQSKSRPLGSPEDEDVEGRRRPQRPDYGVYQPVPPYLPTQAGGPARLMKPPVMGPMMGRMSGNSGGHPPSHMMYGPPMVPPQFMFHPRPGYGPPPPFSGYLPPPPRSHMPYSRPDQGFHHGIPPHMRMPPGSGGEPGPREVIVKDQSLKDFDKISLWEGGWASKVTEVDYSKKLEFSDDEENMGQKSSPSSDAKMHQSQMSYKDIPNDFKSSKSRYDEDMMTFNAKDGAKKVEYEDAGMKEHVARSGSDYKYGTSSPRPVDRANESWGYGRRKTHESLKNEDVYKSPKSFRSEEYYYEDSHGKEDRFEATQFGRSQHKSVQAWSKSSKKEFHDISEPMKSSKVGYKDYKDHHQSSHESKLRRFNSTDSERDDCKDYKHVENVGAATKPFSGLSGKNAESLDHYDLEYSRDKKDAPEEETSRTSSRHHDNVSERARIIDPSIVAKPQLASEKFEKPKRSSTDEERTDINIPTLIEKTTLPSERTSLTSAASRHACPPPIAAKYTRQDPPTQSNYISLKKISKASSSEGHSSLAQSTTSQSSARNAKNILKEGDLEDDHPRSQTSFQSFEDSTSQGGRKNWADSIDEEEMEMKKNVWEDLKKKTNPSKVSAEEPSDRFQAFDLGNTDSYSDMEKPHKIKSNDDNKPTSSKDVRISTEHREYSNKYSDGHRYDDRHQTRKQQTDDFHSGDDGYMRKNKGGHYGRDSGLDAGYQEFTRNNNYGRSSHSQQFRRSNYHVLTSRKSNVSDTNIPEKEKAEHEPKSKSEHSGNPWKAIKISENARDEKKELSSRQRTSESSEVSDRQVALGGGAKVETAKLDEGSGDGICKETEATKDLDVDVLKGNVLLPVQQMHQKVLMSENTWVSSDYKESFQDVEEKKDDVIDLNPGSFKTDQDKERLFFDGKSKSYSVNDYTSLDASDKSVPSHSVCQPPPNVWLSRQRQEHRKTEERIQPTTAVWSKVDSFHSGNLSRNSIDSDTKNISNDTDKDPTNQSQSSTSGSTNSNFKKPPALMDMQIAKPPTSLLKESQLLSSEDLVDWNSTDNLSYPSRRPERRGGYSRVLRGSGNQRRRVTTDRQDCEEAKVVDDEQRSRRGHLHKYGEPNRRSRGLMRGYKGRSDYVEDQQDASNSEDRRRPRSGYSRGESRSLTGDRKITSGSFRGRRRGNKTSISSGTGVASNCATNESDIGNEEWETASESSDVLQNTQPQRNSKTHKIDEEKQKPNKHVSDVFHENKDEVSYSRSKKAEVGYFNKNHTQGQRFQQKRDPIRKNSFSLANKTNQQKSHVEQTTDKPNSLVLKSPAVANSSSDKTRNESTSSSTQNKTKSVKAETTETVKPVKFEREKKDILACIDVNNYASVVVVDNHPEVSIDDPSFLFEKNEGFQEVTSRRALKSKIKAAQQEEAMKKAAELQKAQAAAIQAKKLEKDSLKLRPGGPSSTGDSKLQRSTKVPLVRSNRPKDTKRAGPTLVSSSGRKFSISEDDRNAVLPKIENWNNDMAKSIPPLVPSINHSSASSTPMTNPSSTPSLYSSNTINSEPVGNFRVTPVSHHLGPQDGGMNTQSYQPMYTFPVENWDKESKQDGISKNSNAPLTSGLIFSSMSMPMSEWSDNLLGSKQTVVAPVGSDQDAIMNIQGKEQRDHEVQKQSLREGSVEKLSLTSSPKPTSCHDLQINEPQIVLQQPMIHELTNRLVASAVPKNDTPPSEVKSSPLGVPTDEGRAVKKPEGPGVARSQQNNRTFESLDIHSSIFKYKQGEDSSDIKLDFAFDTSLQSKMPETEKKTSDPGMNTNLSSITAGANNNSSGIGCSVTSSSHLPHVEIMSASDEDLGFKLAQVKNVWDRENVISYEQGMVSVNHRNSKHAAPAVSSIPIDIGDQIRQQQASSYLSGMAASVNDRIVPVAPSQVVVMDSSGVVQSNSHQQPSHLTYTDADMRYKDTSVDTYLSEQPNVCKVKPQLQASLATPSLNQFSGVASPPTPAQQQFMITFGQGSYAFGSQLLTPDCGIGLPFGQHAYLAAPATQTQILAPLAIASQPSLFLGHTPNVQSDLYGTPYRNLFGLTQQPPQQQQQSTIMVSSATSTLMSTAIKNQHHQYISSGSKQQTNTLPAFPYGQLLGNSPIIPQPSQIGLPYDTAQYSAIQADPTIMPPSNSQIVGSHLMPQRNATLHGLSSSAYYPQTLLQQSCFQQQRSGSHLQGSFQQYQLSAAFNMQPVALSVAAGNGKPMAAAAALNFQTQQPLANQSQLKHSAPPFKPSSQRLALSPNSQKFSATGVLNGNNINKNSLLSFHLQQQQEQHNASMLSNSFLLQQNLPNNIGSNMSSHGMNLSSQYQLFTQQQQQQQQLQQLQQTIQLHQQQQQQQHSASSGIMAQQHVQQHQQSNYPMKDRYGMSSMMNQQGKYSQSLPGVNQLQQKFEQYHSDNSMESQQSSNLLQFQHQSKHVDIGSADVSKSSPTLSSSCSASLVPPTNVISQTSMNSSCEVTSNVSTPASTSASSPTSFKSLSPGGSTQSFQSSSLTGNKWNAGGNFPGNMNFQGNQQYQHQSFVPSSDRFTYGYYSGSKSDISRDNSQSSRTSMSSKSVTIRNAGNKGDAQSGFNNGGNGGSFHSGLLRTGGVPGNVGVASRAERSTGFYSMNAKDIKDLQAEERKKAMMDIQSFLNPENKPPQKLLHNLPTSSYLVSKPSNMSESMAMPGCSSIANDNEVGVKMAEN